MNFRKGISPILATVIIIAVTLVIAIGVIGWVMGIWGSFGSTESLQIYPDSYINATTGTLYLHIRNTGTAPANIYKIEVLGVLTTSSSNIASVSAGVGTTVTVSDNSLKNVTPGSSYQVKIYTSAGNVYTAVIQAK